MSSATLDQRPTNHVPRDEPNFISCRSVKTIEIGSEITDYAAFSSAIIRDQHHAVTSAIVGGFSAAAARHPRIDPTERAHFEDVIRTVCGELITNSIYYGMLGLSAAEKGALMGFQTTQARDEVVERINEMLRKGALRSNRSNVFVDVTQSYISLMIDDGCPFPAFVARWNEQKSGGGEDLVSLSGRGLLLMAEYFDHAEILESSTALRLVKLLAPKICAAHE